MKIILVGYPGSQKIVNASHYLTEKYLPGFDITYLNYKGDVNGWANYIAGFLEYLTDSFVIFALDDYLISGPINMDVYSLAESYMFLCRSHNTKLCECSEEEHAEYPVTTQYTIWNRQTLIALLKRVNTPWQFEIEGSRIYKEANGIALLRPCIPYFTNSALSSRWEGIRLDGLKEEDVTYLKTNGLI